MFKHKGQISLEYMIITGFVLVVIIIPTFLLLFTTTNNSVHNRINVQKIEDLGLGVLNDAKQMYYLGLYSNKIVEYEIPRNVEHMYILQLTKPDGKMEYYLGITVSSGQDSQSFNFLSDIPITSNQTYITTDPVITNLVPACNQYACKFYRYQSNTIAPGLRRFKIETLFDTSMQKVISKIYPI